MLRHPLFLCVCLLLALTACDNVGGAFDPNREPEEPNPETTTSTIQAVRNGGDARDGRPKVKAVFPEGGGWPGAVPIVVEFSESLNEASILPTSAAGTDGKVVVRVKGTTQALPAAYDFVAAGRVLVIRPAASLGSEQNPTYEIVLLAGGRDADGVRFEVPTDGEVLAEFQANQSETIADGRILTTFPRDNARDANRESALYVVFDRPPVATSITTSSLFVRPSGGSALAGTTDLPLELLTNDDPRIVRFTPTTKFAAATRYELVVNDTITFGTEGNLDFRGRTPYLTFDTVGPQAPTAITVGNPTTGFDDKINRNNFASVVLHVTTPSDAVAGDRVLARIYGGDRLTTPTGDLALFEKSVVLATGGTQTVVVDFAGVLGTLDRPKVDDGEVTFAAQLQRGSQHSGFARHASSAEPVCDVTPPTVRRLGPPGDSATGALWTDQEALVVYGTASERLGAASLTIGGGAVGLYASSSDGRFVTQHLALTGRVGSGTYSLLVTDLAGNTAAAPSTGEFRLRGRVGGSFSGTLEVEAYDDATLAPIAGATVLVDVDTPTVPATAQVTGTTDAAGRVSFTGLGGTLRTVTVVRSGYHLVTFADTAAGFVSLPLRPQENATATLTGSALFQTSVGTTVLVGANTFDDPLVLSVATTSSAPTAIPNTAIQPNRPQVLTAFGGAFEPTGAPQFALHGYQMLGATMTTATPPAAPVEGGGTSTQTMALLATAGLTAPLSPSVAKDFALANGLDTNNLVGGKPVVRAYASLEGFGGQVLAGVGHATASGGAAFTWAASYGLPLTTGLNSYVPTMWGAIEARDTAGRVSRVRGILLSGIFFDQAVAPSIPVITTPAGAFTSAPLVTVDDTLSSTLVTAGLPVLQLTASDSAGRQWFVWRMDRDGATGGTDTVQFPDLATANVAGLATGAWSIRAEGRVFLQLINMAGIDDFVLAEARRMEVTYARSTAVTHTVQ